jgi:large conductance mechanosensitive channel
MLHHERLRRPEPRILSGRSASVLREFKAFILRGNIVELAVAVVVGVAFTAVVNALVKDFITPLIAAIFGKPNFGHLSFTINHSIFAYGDFFNALLSFLIEATAVFFLVVLPLTRLMTRLNLLPAEKAAPPTRPCPQCLSDIAAAAQRCAFCTSEVTPQ